MASKGHAHELRDTLSLMAFIWLAALSAASPVPEIDFIMQAGGVGAALGLGIAYYLYRDYPDADRWRPVATYTLAGLGGGMLIVLVDLIVRLT